MVNDMTVSVEKKNSRDKILEGTYSKFICNTIIDEKMISDRGLLIFKHEIDFTVIFEADVCPLVNEARVLPVFGWRYWPCAGVMTNMRIKEKRLRCREYDISETIIQHLKW